MGLTAEALSWRFDCPDWEDRLREGRSLLPDDLPLDWAEAERAVTIFNKLRLPDVPGQPLLAEAAGEWQRDIVRAIFGSLDPETKLRVIREIFALVPKKNAKTTGGAAIMVTALLMNERPRAEFVLVGPTQEVADLAFQQASGMIDADDYLRTRYQVQEHIKTIRDRLTGAKLKVKTFDMKVATGSKPAGILLDELHLMSTMTDATRIIGQLRGGMIANPEAFLIIITTQSDQPPAGAFKSELDYARGVRDGRITADVATLPMLYEFSEATQTDPSRPWAKPAIWKMVLPNLGRSITIERLASEYRTACEKGPEEERRWASQHLNIQIGMALHTDRWRGVDYWEKSINPALRDLDTFLAACDVVVAGFDGGGDDDLSGLVLIGRCKVTREWLLWSRAWVHFTALDLRPEIAPRLRDFAAQGDLVIWGAPDTPSADSGDWDVLEIADLLAKVRNRGLMPAEGAVGLDAAGLGTLIDELKQRGFVDKQMWAVGQGYRLTGIIALVQRKLWSGQLTHGGQEMMAWCVSNAKAEQKGNAVLITKQTAGKAKIDPVIAMFNAAKMMERSPDGSGSIDDFIAKMKAAA